MDDESSSQPLKVVLVYPLAPSLEWATPILLQRSDDFAITMVQGSLFSFSGFDPSEPSLFLFSVMDPASRTQVKAWLETKPPLPPGHRILVISEEKKGMAVGGWKNLGVNEYILGPVVAHTVLQKLQRHKTKMEAELSEAGVKYVPRPPRPQGHRVLLQNKGDTLEREFAVHGVVLGPNTFLFPREEDAKEVRKVVVEGEFKGFNPKQGEWQPSAKNAPGAPVGEKSWDWVYTVGAPQEAKDDGSFRFVGQKPVFDAESGQWRFQGSAPLMFHNKPGESSSAATPATMFGYHTSCGVVMYKASGVIPASARVWFVRTDNFKGTPLEHFQKKPKPHETGGSDSELLKVLNDALKTSPIHGKKKT